MKIFFSVIFGLLFFVGFILFAKMTSEQRNQQEIHEYISSRGASPPPYSWKGKIGGGI